MPMPSGSRCSQSTARISTLRNQYGGIDRVNSGKKIHSELSKAEHDWNAGRAASDGQ
jgi:hypothetical protein